MRVILVAPPGAGKGTQGERIATRYDVPHIASGDLFRAEVARDTVLGRSVRNDLDAGELVPDRLVVELLTPPVIQAAREDGGYVLDGFPRTVEQARLAAEVAREHGILAQVVLALDAPEEVLLDRLVGRAGREGRRDDASSTIRHRLEIYVDQTRPLIDFYAQRGILHRIDATPPADEVSAAIFSILDPLG